MMLSTVRAMRRKIGNLYKREVLRDEFLLEARRWFSDKGDETYRMNYELDENSIVVDLGGYLGDFASDIHDRFGSTIHLFEPVPHLHGKCVERFRDNPKVISHCYGLGSVAGHFPITDSANESSFINMAQGQNTVLAEVRSVDATFRALGIEKIDLLKINIEGGEYDVIPACIDTGWISRTANLQVQFHNFVPGAERLREHIRTQLANSHRETWCYKFVWENWQLMV